MAFCRTRVWQTNRLNHATRIRFTLSVRVGVIRKVTGSNVLPTCRYAALIDLSDSEAALIQLWTISNQYRVSIGISTGNGSDRVRDQPQMNTGRTDHEPDLSYPCVSVAKVAKAPVPIPIRA